jgi:tight adherence protein B
MPQLSLAPEDLVAIAVFVGALLAFGALALAVGNAGADTRERIRARLAAAARQLPGAGPSAAPGIRLARDEGRGFERWLQRRLPSRAALARRLARTGRSITLSRYVFACFALALLAAAAIRMFVGLPLPVALGGGLAIGLIVPHFVVGRLIRRRLAAFRSGFPDAIDVVVRSVKSGLPVSEAIHILASEFPAPIGPEFAKIGDGMALGRSMEEALWEAARRLALPEFDFFAISLSVQRETGGNLAETLGNLSDILRKRQQMKLKVHAMSSEARASALVLGLLPFGIFTLLLLVSPDYVLRLFDDPRGQLLVAAGVGSQMTGFAVMVKMTRFEI